MPEHSILVAAEELIEGVRRSGLKKPGRIVFEPGGFRRLGEHTRDLCAPGPVLAIAPSARIQDPAFRAFLEAQFAGAGAVHCAAADEEPTTAMVNAQAELARRIAPGLVVGIGGGSAMDAAKAAAALAVNDGPVEDYLEGLGRERKLERPPLPVVAMPTTAGTGTEMTKNAVVCDPARHFKKSMRDERMIPAMALIDPVLCCSAPRGVTAAGGMDAITQLIESCITVKRRPEVTALALSALRWPRRALPHCVRTPQDLDARVAMSLAAAVSGVCLANAGLAMAHGVAAGLGALHRVPHGLACGLLLPHTLRHSRGACAAELGAALAAFLDEPAPDATTVDRGISAIAELNRELGLPPDLKHLGLGPEDRRALARASLGSSMSGNPVPMTEETIGEFLETIC